MHLRSSSGGMQGIEYCYRGNAKTVTSDKQSMALTVTGQGQLPKQYTDSVFHASLRAQTPPKAMEDGEPQDADKGSLLSDDMKETWAECKQKLVNRLGTPRRYHFSRLHTKQAQERRREIGSKDGKGEGDRGSQRERGKE